MATLSHHQLAARILEFAKNGSPVVFTGAGVGKQVDLPLWSEYLEQLALVCDQYGDVPSGDLIRQRVAKGNFLGAAAVYESCTDIPVGERWKKMAEPFVRTFTDEQLDKLKPLFALPFGAVVTTNYDRSQQDAIARARGRSAIPLELDDKSLRSGPLQTNLYVARLHGRAESPATIILTPTGYERLSTNDIYKDFLLTLLKQRPCLFLGFSFSDPAISSVLDTYEAYAGPVFPILHTALLPAGSDAETLRQRLLSLNINVYHYDGAKGHKDLWRAIRKAEADLRREEAAPGEKAAPKIRIGGESTFKRFFAFTYAQIQTASELRPLVDQTRDGLVLSLVREAGMTGATHETLLGATRQALQLDADEAEKVLRESLSRLLTVDDLRRDQDRYLANTAEGNLLGEHLELLTRGALDRLKVREGVSPDEKDSIAVRAILERALIVRAWDVAAHYAGGGAGYSADLATVIHDIVEEFAAKRLPSRRLGIERAVFDLLVAPSDSESERLAELGRTAFALQLVLASPRQTLLQRFALPRIVYFDASVLLPALVPGHPLRQLYLDAIKRLREAAREAGITCELLVGEPFLNEIISHRLIGVRIAEEWRIDDPSKLKQLIAFRGRQEDVNVFIGGFASQIGRVPDPQQTRPTFKEYLQRVAPYTSEESLARHLTEQGFKIVPMDFRQHNNTEFIHILNPLRLAYEKQFSDKLDLRQRVLVKHEAQQLTQLDLDERAGIRAIFVSADRGLYRAILASGDLHRFSGAAVSPEGFLGLIDVMVGLKTDSRALARMMWASPRRGVDQAIRDYLVRRALQEMDIAMTKAMPQLIDTVVTEAKKDLRARNLDWFSHDVDDIARTAQFMDRLEEKFFGKMREAIERSENK